MLDKDLAMLYKCKNGTKEINQAGEVRVSLQDNKWRVIYNGSLALIDNPFLYNEKVINYLVNIVDGLEQKDLKNLVVLSKTCTISKTEEYENEIIATENDAINKILEFEKKSNEDIIDPFEIEKYCQAFYNEGLKAEKALKNRG